MREELIGDCRLILGDCREVLPTLPRVDATVTDPPYGMAFVSNRRKEKYDAIANDDADWPLQMAATIAASHSNYIFCRWDNLASVPKPKSVITWVKNNHSSGDLKHEHGRKTELVLFYPGPSHFWPQGRPSDVLEAPKTGNKFHPTEKPVSLMQDIIRWTNGTVLDPFMGSGTTGVACAALGRPFIGIEVNEVYFNIACERIAKAYEQGKLV